MNEKIKWTPELVDELFELRKRGKSLADLKDLIYSKFGIVVTTGRISQVLRAQWKIYQGELDAN